MNEILAKRIVDFARDARMSGKGPLSVALVVTRHAKHLGLPLKSESLLTGGQGQVAGLGKAGVQSILSDHNIDRVLAEEGGRTSRGAVGRMHAYVAFLNDLHSDCLADLDAIEEWWIERVRDFFSSKPFILRFDSSKSLQAALRDLLGQAEKRERDASGTKFVGIVIQHLVGAKLDLLVGELTHHGASVADEGLGRDADFLVGDTAIHVTTFPSEALIRKCERNLGSGLHPLVLTIGTGTTVAQALAEDRSIADRIDVLDVAQFVAGNLYEHGQFHLTGRWEAAERLISKYNDVVERSETDPSLRINLGK